MGEDWLYWEEPCLSAIHSTRQTPLPTALLLFLSPRSPVPVRTSSLTAVRVHSLKITPEILTLKPTTFHDIHTKQLLLAPFS